MEHRHEPYSVGRLIDSLGQDLNLQDDVTLVGLKFEKLGEKDPELQMENP